MVDHSSARSSAWRESTGTFRHVWLKMMIVAPRSCSFPPRRQSTLRLRVDGRDLLVETPQLDGSHMQSVRHLPDVFDGRVERSVVSGLAGLPDVTEIANPVIVVDCEARIRTPIANLSHRSLQPSRLRQLSSRTASAMPWPADLSLGQSGESGENLTVPLVRSQEIATPRRIGSAGDRRLRGADLFWVSSRLRPAGVPDHQRVSALRFAPPHWTGPDDGFLH